ncbi:MAG TPA: hypothetical protein VHD56_09380 [Tepidisphaeraceae bacterium]|nr:hypothetical protein [Tepidisphaeraceae bacterium]
MPTIRNGIINITGTHKADDLTISREAGKPLVPLTARFYALISSIGDVIVARGTATGALLTPPPSGQSVQSRIVVPSGNYIHIHGGAIDIFVQAGGINGISVNAGDGNDHVVIAKNVRLPTTLLGGAGDDTLEGGTSSDSLDGGAGDDVLFGGHGAADDQLDGGTGNDIFYVDVGDTVTHNGVTTFIDPLHVGLADGVITKVILL